LKRLSARFSIFKLSDIVCAWEILFMQEVLPLPPITRVPNASPKVLGVFNARGKIIPLIDIRPFLKMDSSVPKSSDMVMLIRENTFLTGILINEVVSILDIEYEQQGAIKGAAVHSEDLFLGIHTDPELGKIYLMDKDKLIKLVNKPLTEI
jgi:chemotaxis signal transduction protein